MNVTVATPVGLVTDVADENEPSVAFLLHVMTRPFLEIPLPLASVRNAVTVVLVPAYGFGLLSVRTNLFDEEPSPVASVEAPHDATIQIARANATRLQC